MLSLVDLDDDERLDPTGPVHPYRQIADVLARRIRRGVYSPGERIPTETEIMGAFEVARTTSRKAVALLRKDGLVYTVPQRGSYVRRDAEP